MGTPASTRPRVLPRHRNGGKYTCPMHPEIVRDKPGDCPICGMHVVSQQAEAGGHGHAGVESVVLFGSIARGEAGEGSDIDLAVIAAPGWDGRTDFRTP